MCLLGTEAPVSCRSFCLAIQPLHLSIHAVCHWAAAEPPVPYLVQYPNVSKVDGPSSCFFFVVFLFYFFIYLFIFIYFLATGTFNPWRINWKLCKIVTDVKDSITPCKPFTGIAPTMAVKMIGADHDLRPKRQGCIDIQPILPYHL